MTNKERAALNVIIAAVNDGIVASPENVTQVWADALLTAVRVFDPTDSGLAARVRDTIRDNTELNV